MTVVIHDFEIVAEPKQPAPQQTSAASAAAQRPISPPTPQDIERVVHRLKERHARIRAH